MAPSRAAGPRSLAWPAADRPRGGGAAALLAAGRSNQRIAHELVVALDTVKKHVTHVLGDTRRRHYRTEAVARQARSSA